jgi:bifunctional enzyme CysN/CysC
MSIIERDLAPDDLHHATGAGLLRIATAGSVDDGKSTLIGRLLHDTKTVMTDHLAAADRASERYGEAARLALLTDGLRAEREQGITIDVAYRFFATPARSFIVADTPGHVQYTRNMVTGASTSDVAIVLVDARNGLVEQSRRHLHLATLLGIRHLVVAVNKMDLVDWSQDVFDAISAACERHLADLTASGELGAAAVTTIPVSALHGDNVVTPGQNTPWYDGPTLLGHLETLDVEADAPAHGARLAVQWVIRPHSDDHHDYRGVAGRLAGGELRPGDDVTIEPSGVRTRVAAIDTFDGPLDVATPGRAITIRFTDDVDASRGDSVVAIAGSRPQVGHEVLADVCWMIDQPLTAGTRVWVKHGTRLTRAVVTELVHRQDVVDLDVEIGPASLGLNDIGRIRLHAAAELVADPYVVDRATGRFVIIDEATNATAGAAMVRRLS